MSQTQIARSKALAEKVTRKPVGYTLEPWEVADQPSGEAWVVSGKSAEHGARQIATIPHAASDQEQRANASLIVMAPALHRAGVRLLCAWGTEDAPEAMTELALILSQAVRS